MIYVYIYIYISLLEDSFEPRPGSLLRTSDPVKSEPAT